MNVTQSVSFRYIITREISLVRRQNGLLAYSHI